MRNQNIYTAKVSQGLIVSTPSNAKPLTTLFPRIFATVVQNATEFTRSYRLTIASQPPGGPRVVPEGRRRPSRRST